MNEEDKKFLKYLSLESLKIFKDALSTTIRNNTIRPLDIAKDLDKIVGDILSEKKVADGDIMGMSFEDYKKHIKLKDSVKMVEPSTGEKLNVWDFLLNIRQYIKEADSTEMQTQHDGNARSFIYRFFMDGGDIYTLVIHYESRGHSVAIRLVKNDDVKTGGTIFITKPDKENPLNMKLEDVQMFIQYIDDLRKTRWV